MADAKRAADFCDEWVKRCDSAVKSLTSETYAACFEEMNKLDLELEEEGWFKSFEMFRVGCKRKKSILSWEHVDVNTFRHALLGHVRDIKELACEKDYHDALDPAFVVGYLKLIILKIKRMLIEFARKSKRPRVASTFTDGRAYLTHLIEICDSYINHKDPYSTWAAAVKSDLAPYESIEQVDDEKLVESLRALNNTENAWGVRRQITILITNIMHIDGRDIAEQFMRNSVVSWLVMIKKRARKLLG
jgi:hypothetical protein